MTMGGGGQPLRNIMITVAKQNSTQMAAASGGGAGGVTAGGGGGGGGASAGSKELKKGNEDQKKGLTKLLKSVLGVELGLAVMLKQSQIFTGFMGSIFQLTGALVDVILAPLAPFLFKMVEVIAQFIPKIAVFAQGTVDWLKSVVQGIADIASRFAGRDVSVGEMAKSGLEIISFEGMSIFLSNKVAGMFGKATIGEQLDKIFPEGGIAKEITKAIKSAGSKIWGAFKLAAKVATAGFFGKVIKVIRVLGKGIKILAILGIAFEIGDIVKIFKEGKIGEGIVKVFILVVAGIIPLLLAIFVGGVPILIGGIIVGLGALLFELFASETVKQNVYSHIEGVLQESTQVFQELFKGGFIEGLLNMLNPVTLLTMGMSILLSEGVKRTINDGFRNFLDNMVNGFIRTINKITSWVTDQIPTEIKIFGKTFSTGLGGIDLSIGEVDFSNMNLLMGVDSEEEQQRQRSAKSWAKHDLALTGNLGMFQ